jgi:aspartokinase
LPVYAGLGAKIINDVALRPARERGILVKILNSFDINQTGTNILANPSTDHYGVKAIANVPDYQLITVYDMRMNQKGIARKVASLFAEYDLSIDAESEGDFCKTYAVIPNDNTSKLLNKLSSLGHRTTTINRMARIALVGEGMEYIPHTNSKTANQILLETLKIQGIPLEMYTLARDSIILSFFIPQEYTHQAITHLYRAFEFHRNGNK